MIHLYDRLWITITCNSWTMVVLSLRLFKELIGFVGNMLHNLDDEITALQHHFTKMVAFSPDKMELAWSKWKAAILVHQGKKDVFYMGDPSTGAPESRTEPINPSIEVMNMPTDSRVEPMVEMTFLTLPIEVSTKVAAIRVEGIVGTSKPEILMGFAKVAEAILVESCSPIEAQDLKVLCNFKVSELKELLSEKSLFNVGISTISPKEFFRKRRMEVVGEKSAQARVGLLPAPLVFRLEDPEPLAIESFEIMQIPHGFDLSILEGGQGSPIKCLFSEAILSLPAPDISNLFSEEHPVDVVEIFMAASNKVKLVKVSKTSNASTSEEWPTTITGPSGTAMTGMGIHDSILEYYKFVSEVFSNILHPINAMKLLTKPLKIRRCKAVDCFLRLAHYLNGFMERTSKAMRFRTEVKMLKVAKDRPSERAEEASTRIEAIEKRAQDAKATLVKSIKENSHLLGIKEALTLKIEALKTRLVEVDVFKEGARAALKDAEKRMALL
ncbi:hypothetical protein COCNU_05G002990 [Cocos nucifera]|uniref:Uncharacterized protein n=1 Tax=Cocos nucifera TaxID=13894 RepID=A0A8K0N198_COCNU|nr:hypothetical protein COCNU_05G002990 [Cocos nucifera]